MYTIKSFIIIIIIISSIKVDFYITFYKSQMESHWWKWIFLIISLMKVWINWLLNLKAPTAQNGQIHSNNLLAVADELFECVWPFWEVGAFRVTDFD